MFNCKYVENTPDTKSLLTHRIQAFQSDSVRFKQRQSRAVGKSEVGSWKLEVGSGKSEGPSRLSYIRDELYLV